MIKYYDINSYWKYNLIRISRELPFAFASLSIVIFLLGCLSQSANK